MRQDGTCERWVLSCFDRNVDLDKRFVPGEQPSCVTATKTTTLRLSWAHLAGGWSPISVALSLTSANAACSLARSGLVNRGSLSVVAATRSCSSFLPTHRGIARLSRPRATVCRFHTHKNYAVTRVSGMRFEPETDRLRIQRATNGPLWHAWLRCLQFYSGWGLSAVNQSASWPPILLRSFKMHNRDASDRSAHSLMLLFQDLRVSLRRAPST